MKNHKLLFLTLSFLLIASCNKNEDKLPSEERFYIQYGDSTIETNGGLLYLYNKIDQDYYYVINTGNSGYKHIGWGVDDTYSNGDYVKLHFKADTITNLVGTYQIINDSNNYIVFGYNDTLKTYSKIDYITSGNISVSSFHSNTKQPRSLKFEGLTFSGKSIRVNYFISTPEVSYKFTRQVKGNFQYKNENYDLSNISVSHDTSDFKIQLYDINIDDSIFVQLQFYLYKTENDQMEGNYFGSETRMPNSFHGIISVKTLNYNVIHEDYFNNGELIIKKNNDNNYSLDFNLVTENNDSITGQIESKVEIQN